MTNSTLGHGQVILQGPGQFLHWGPTWNNSGKNATLATLVEGTEEIEIE